MFRSSVFKRIFITNYLIFCWVQTGEGYTEPISPMGVKEGQTLSFAKTYSMLYFCTKIPLLKATSNLFC
jgi:hypothetical protein